MYELVRTQLYLNMVHGVVIYYQLHVSASILAIIRFTLGLNLLREIYKLYGVLRGGERDLVLQIVGSLKCRNLGWSIDLRCSCCRGAPWSAFVWTGIRQVISSVQLLLVSTVWCRYFFFVGLLVDCVAAYHNLRSFHYVLVCWYGVDTPDQHTNNISKGLYVQPQIQTLYNVEQILLYR